MSLIGKAIPRAEDARLLRGEGVFTDDLQRQGQCYAAFLRSDRAAGLVNAIDLSAAQTMAGVRFALAATQAETYGLGCFPTLGEMPGQFSIARPVMPRQVRHVGEILAMVVAESPDIAEAALETIIVEFGAADAALHLTADEPERLAYDWRQGETVELQAAFARAHWIASVSAISNRVIVHPLETRAALAEHDPTTGCTTLCTSSQGAHKLRDMLAAALGWDRASLRVVTPDVGGAFGMKLQAYPEQALVAMAARQLRCPVKWTASRRESSLMDAHGRAQALSARLALDAQGRFLALEIDNVADLGAYTTGFGALTPSVSGGKVAGHVYDIPLIGLRVAACYTNTVPVDAYRGAGKPEMVYILERVIEEASRVSGIDRVALRRRNLIASASLPHALPLGQHIDTGDFNLVLERVLAISDWPGFERRRQAAKARGRLAGIGLGLHMHVSGGFTNERSVIEVTGDGQVIVDTGTQAGGQGHATVFAQIVADRLDIDVGCVQVHQGDTDRLDDGGGTGGSSSLPIAGVNIGRAADALLAQARALAADHFEAAIVDLHYAAGRFSVLGTDRSRSIFDLAQDRTLHTGCDYTGDHATFPNGAYVAEVEIDPETGHLDLVRFSGVDDIGTVVNPLIALGQIHGGIVQGLGQVLCEQGRYDRTGQLLTATLMDYALPRAIDICALDCHFEEIPATANPLGAKGAGELGPAGALAPVVHAVLDALSAKGVRSIDMPLTSETIWRAMGRAV